MSFLHLYIFQIDKQKFKFDLKNKQQDKWHSTVVPTFSAKSFAKLAVKAVLEPDKITFVVIRRDS